MTENDQQIPKKKKVSQSMCNLSLKEQNETIIKPYNSSNPLIMFESNKKLNKINFNFNSSLKENEKFLIKIELETQKNIIQSQYTRKINENHQLKQYAKNQTLQLLLQYYNSENIIDENHNQFSTQQINNNKLKLNFDNQQNDNDELTEKRKRFFEQFKSLKTEQFQKLKQKWVSEREKSPFKTKTKTHKRTISSQFEQKQTKTQNRNSFTPQISQRNSKTISIFSGNSKSPRISFQKQSNKLLIKNAITNVLLAGQTIQHERERVLSIINQSPYENFIILFKSNFGRQDFRAVYSYNPTNDEVKKLYSRSGGSPLYLDCNMVLNYYRYDSGAKSFNPIPSKKTFSIAVDAVALYPSTIKSYI